MIPHPPARPLRLAGLLTAAAIAACSLAGCSREYPQDSPEALVDSARQMVLDGKAGRLSELVLTQSDGERLVVDRLGRTLAVLQRLGQAIAQAFPQEVERIRREADQAVEQGRIDSLLGRALTASSGVARGAPQAVRDERRLRQGLDSVLRELLADPYGWLERHGDKLQPLPVTDDLVALSWQGRPVVGLRLVERDGKWYFQLPLDVPALQRFLPRNDEEFQIWAELVASVHNVLLDLAIEVEQGKHKNLESVASTAGEYALPTAFMVMIAYGKALEERQGGG
ncbi:MAG: hypothetical protein KatS3mg103_0120 [Phycisphaerales bacterium]|nr:MAG: hypothetical protein KatS3mg103_0120 [Phycisphaerales bacterium]